MHLYVWKKPYTTASKLLLAVLNLFYHFVESKTAREYACLQKADCIAMFL